MEEVSKHCQSMANEDGRVDPEKGFRKFIKEQMSSDANFKKESDAIDKDQMQLWVN